MTTWSLEALKEKSRLELVDIAQEMYIDGLFRMDENEIAEAIHKVSEGSPEAKNVKRTYSHIDWEKRDLEEKSRSELVDIAHELDIDGLFLMSDSEIVEAIRNPPEKNERQDDIQSREMKSDQDTEEGVLTNEASGYVRGSNKPPSEIEGTGHALSQLFSTYAILC